MSNWFGKKRGNATLIIDINSGSTGAALVSSKSQDVPRILARTQTPYSWVKTRTSSNMEGAMLVSLRNTLAQIISELALVKDEDLKEGIDKAIVTFSSPWIDSYLRTTKISKKDSFVFDKEMLNLILVEEKKTFNSKLNESFKEESQIFESSILRLYLNGYSSSEPISGRVNEVELSLILSATTKDFIEKIENELIKTVGLKRGVALHSFMYVFYKILSHSYRSIHSALLVDVTAEATDILFLHHGSSAIKASLAFGPGTIVRAVAEKLKVKEEIAHSYISLFAHEALDQPTIQIIDEVLTGNEDLWRSLWKDTEEKIKKSADVPYSIFLLTPPGSGKIMETFLENVFKGKHIIMMGETNSFTKELARGTEQIMNDERMLMLASFSNLLN